MKIAINTRLKDGPWGGGNRFLHSLTNALVQRGDQVFFDLLRKDIDLILIIDPRRRNPQLSFTINEIIDYRRINQRAIIIHRINECDERKNTLTMNLRLRLANVVADHTIFIATWLRYLSVWNNFSDHSIIHNGASEVEFPRNSASKWEHPNRLRIVTHHWGSNELKGWDVYKKIDILLSDPYWHEKIEFTFIGNKPQNIHTRNIHLIKALNGKELSQELSSNHVYISASQNEPAGMHHIEAAILGLPLIYRNSGALPEYCNGFGEIFEGADDIGMAIDGMIRNYNHWKSMMPIYTNTSSRMVGNYLSLFDRLLLCRDEIVAKRLSIGLFQKLANRIIN